MSTLTETVYYDKWGLVAMLLSHEDDGAVRFTILDGRIRKTVVIPREHLEHMRAWINA